MAPKPHFLAALLILFAVVPSARAENPFATDADLYLKAGLSFQDELIRINSLELDGTHFDELYDSVARIEKDLQTRGLLLRAGTVEGTKYRAWVPYVTSRLPVLKALSKQQLDIGAGIAQQLSTSAPKDYFFEQFQEARMAGFRVPESYNLYNGSNITKTPAAKAELSSLEDPVFKTLGTGVRELCLYDPKNIDDNNRVLNLFLGEHARNMSCMTAADSARLLPDPSDALNEKILLLTGHTLTPEQLAAHDPDMKLVFDEKTPKLEAVIMGYLEYKNDFSGQIMSQALRYQMDHGAQVRLILPGLPIPGTNFIHAPDKALLDSLEKAYPKNFKLLKYTFFEKNPDFGIFLGFLQRSYHAKAMVALSSRPGESGVIIGGRNIKDTFYFKEAPKFPNHPEMIHYGDKSEPYIFFGDLEVSIRSREIAEQVAANILSFWDRDTMGPRMRSMSEHVPSLQLDSESRAAMIEKARKTSMVRFWYSVPYLHPSPSLDHHEMEQLYIDLIGSAKRSLKLVNPYVVPTAALAKALRDASIRGVDIDFVSTLSFVGDNSPSFTGDLNVQTFEKLKKQNDKDLKKNTDKTPAAPIHIFEWSTTPRSIMHAKTMLVDDEILLIGSANFDYRSLVQDIEDGFLISGPVAQEYKKLFDDYFLANSKPMTSGKKIGLLSRFLSPVLHALELPPPKLPDGDDKQE